jgi:hypothetical protein
MRWLRVDEHGFDYCYLLPDPGETDRTIVAAVAAASFNTAWPEGYGWEQWDPTGDVALDNVRRLLPDIFKRARPRTTSEVLSMGAGSPWPPALRSDRFDARYDLPVSVRHEVDSHSRPLVEHGHLAGIVGP